MNWTPFGKHLRQVVFKPRQENNVSQYSTTKYSDSFKFQKVSPFSLN